ncbi:MAG: Fic family protein [Bradymonadia bacterium]|jgi:Fic family protein
MESRETGQYEDTPAGGETVRAFVPHALPPERPALAIEGNLAERVGVAEQALTRLELAGEMVPSLDWFVYAFVRKEAVISSQIEGTQATLIDLLSYEAESDPPTPSGDIEEVCNYLDALTFARAQLADPTGLPLSVRLLNETHRVLLRGARGETKMPGEVRRSQNWVGGSRPGNAAYVPPPPHLLPELLSDFERYIHGADGLPPLVKAGLLHVQFETIHPYLDGNGRIGRLLVRRRPGAATRWVTRWARRRTSRRHDRVVGPPGPPARRGVKAPEGHAPWSPAFLELERAER